MNRTEQIIELRNKGLSIAQVAEEIGVSTTTVQKHSKKSGYLGQPFPLSNPKFVNPDQLEQSRQKHCARTKRWRLTNPGKAREQNRQGSRRRTADPRHRVLVNLRKRISDTLHGDIKEGRTLELCGCTRQELIAHLEAQFEPGMTWDNYGVFGWHVDHIVSCWRFDRSDPDWQRKCFHYTNLQPLWREDNMAKRDHWGQI